MGLFGDLFHDKIDERLLRKADEFLDCLLETQKQSLEIQQQQVKIQQHSLRILERINRKLPDVFTIRITLESPIMAIGNIDAGSTGQLGLVLLENGAPFTPPEGSSFVFSPNLTADDPQVTFAPATTDASGGTVPLEDQVVVSVPAGDPSTSVTITATATDPNGGTATGTLTIALTPTPQVFTIAVSQLA